MNIGLKKPEYFPLLEIMVYMHKKDNEKSWLKILYLMCFMRKKITFFPQIFSEYFPDSSFMINYGHSMSPVYLDQKHDSRWWS